MTDLPDGAALILLAMSVGERLTATDGQWHLSIDGHDGLHSPPQPVDELEGRGYIDLSTDPATLTDRGRFWLGKWARKRLGKGRFRLTPRGRHADL